LGGGRHFWFFSHFSLSFVQKLTVLRKRSDAGHSLDSSTLTFTAAIVRTASCSEFAQREFEPTELLTTAETADKAIFSRAKDWISAANRA
jgi:hypothetical protein